MGFDPMPAPTRDVLVRISFAAIIAGMPRLIKAYNFLSFLFINNTVALIAYLKGSLLDCFEWESTIARDIDARLSNDCHYAFQEINA